jgi:D-alanine-D-alanine ligase
MKKNVAVITGGEASEVGIALKSAKVAFKYIDRNLFDVYLIVIEGNDWWYVADEKKQSRIDKNDFSLTVDNTKIRFDAVFVAIHGTPAEDGKLQGYFDMLKIPYNCCGVLQAALTFDKSRTKEYLAQLGIKTATSVVGFKAINTLDFEKEIKDKVPFPVFVKPNKNGSSYGASKVNDEAGLKAAIDNAFVYDDEVIVEEFLKGREVTNGVFILDGKVTALPITEVLTQNEFFDYKAKYEGASQEITPADLDESTTKAIQKTSVDIYQKLGFKGMCRVDYIITERGIYMLEVNAIPGMSEESIIPQQARVAGFDLTFFFTNSVVACLAGR